ncbi:ABC transporter ATP-binding protein [Acidisoma cellulosilytica]|uniref:ABC transporter ATP-binding protein n=1 Tax=Acidisoma cellulosilyticum TaxID=2802395 RepID=A0A963Z694_9PROT|nr:ABC transporter ATP-binding protein [Acidisoma cellulosilyticum]MCB8882627.1 ABC transporter ATP-binding protein [Acidisoma cellulosilyticum]
MTSLKRPDTPLQALDLGKAFLTDAGEELDIIRSVSFTLERGEIVSLVGPSGCGKTTLLNLLCRLIEPSQGTVLWNGRESDGVPAGVGYMLQKDLLLPWRSAIQNVMLGLQVKGGTRAAHRARAKELLDQLGLGGFADHYPSTLSGGMRQRVALARTLAPEPEVLLFDEPFSALDFQTKILIERDTLRLVREMQRSLLLITHDVEEAVSLSDRVIVLSRRPSTIVSEHRIELPGDRSNLIALRESTGFAHYVRQIWTELDVQ